MSPSDPPVAAPTPTLSEEIALVLRQCEMTAARADALPPNYTVKPTIAEWRSRVSWLSDVLRRTLAGWKDVQNTRHGGNVGATPFYLFPYQCEPEYDQGHWVVVWYDDLYNLANPQPDARVALVARWRHDTEDAACTNGDTDKPCDGMQQCAQELEHVLETLPSVCPDARGGSVDLLEEVDEFLDNYVDVDDGDDGTPVANAAMSLQMAIRAHLKAITTGANSGKPDRVAAPTPQDVTKEEFIRQVKDEALRLQRAYKLSSAAALQEAFHRFEPFRVPERAAPTPETPSQPTDAPPDKAGRLMLNAYGRQCWDAGFAAGKLAGAVSHPQPEPRTTKDDEVARVDVKCLSDRQDLPRKSQRGDSMEQKTLAELTKWPTEAKDLTVDLLIRIVGRDTQMQYLEHWESIGKDKHYLGSPLALARTLGLISSVGLMACLRELHAAAPEKADEFIRDYWGMCDAGDSFGEYLWDYMRQAGLDPELIQLSPAAALAHPVVSPRTET